MRTLIAVSALALLGACQMTEAPPSFQPSQPLPDYLDRPMDDAAPVVETETQTTTADPAVPRLPPSSDCGASQMQQHVGGPIPDPFPAGDNPMRIYRAGDPVSQDFAPERLNIQLDTSGSRIVSITCG